jgi:hypothetical protein
MLPPDAAADGADVLDWVEPESEEVLVPAAVRLHSRRAATMLPIRYRDFAEWSDTLLLGLLPDKRKFNV